MISTILAAPIPGENIKNPAIGDLNRFITLGPGATGGVGYLSALISVMLTIILIVGSLYFVFQFLTGGVAWIGSGGDKNKLEEARQKLLNAIIGLVILFAAWAVFTLIENVFGINLLLIDIPTLATVGTP